MDIVVSYLAALWQGNVLFCVYSVWKQWAEATILILLFLCHLLGHCRLWNFYLLMEKKEL